jgi:hypothetical protein
MGPGGLRITENQIAAYNLGKLRRRSVVTTNRHRLPPKPGPEGSAALSILAILSCYHVLGRLAKNQSSPIRRPAKMNLGKLGAIH